MRSNSEKIRSQNLFQYGLFLVLLGLPHLSRANEWSPPNEPLAQTTQTDRDYLVEADLRALIESFLDFMRLRELANQWGAQVFIEEDAAYALVQEAFKALDLQPLLHNQNRQLDEILPPKLSHLKIRWLTDGPSDQEAVKKSIEGILPGFDLIVAFTDVSDSWSASPLKQMALSVELSAAEGDPVFLRQQRSSQSGFVRNWTVFEQRQIRKQTITIEDLRAPIGSSAHVLLKVIEAASKHELFLPQEVIAFLRESDGLRELTLMLRDETGLQSAKAFFLPLLLEASDLKAIRDLLEQIGLMAPLKALFNETQLKSHTSPSLVDLEGMGATFLLSHFLFADANPLAFSDLNAASLDLLEHLRSNENASDIGPDPHQIARLAELGWLLSHPRSLTASIDLPQLLNSLDGLPRKSRQYILSHVLKSAHPNWWSEQNAGTVLNQKITALTHRLPSLPLWSNSERVSLEFRNNLQDALIYIQFLHAGKEIERLTEKAHRLVDLSDPLAISESIYQYLLHYEIRLPHLESKMTLALREPFQTNTSPKDWAKWTWWLKVASPSEKAERYEAFWMHFMPLFLPEVIDWAEQGWKPEPPLDAERDKAPQRVDAFMQLLKWQQDASPMRDRPLFWASFFSALADVEEKIQLRSTVPHVQIEHMLEQELTKLLGSEIFKEIKYSSQLAQLLRGILPARQNWLISLLNHQAQPQKSKFEEVTKRIDYLRLVKALERSRGQSLTRLVHEKLGLGSEPCFLLL